jgi:hypothetical protein
MKHYFPGQKELWQTFEEASGYVRPERVNKWPKSITNIYDDDETSHSCIDEEFKSSWNALCHSV